MSLSAIYLDGSLDVSGHYNTETAYEDISIQYTLEQVARNADNNIGVTIAPQYYIEATGNLNTFFDVSLGGSDTTDDAWSCSKFFTTNDSSTQTSVSINKLITDISLSDGTNTNTFTINHIATTGSGTINVGRTIIEASGNLNGGTGDVAGSGDVSKNYFVELTTTINTDGTLSFQTTNYNVNDNITIEVTGAEDTLYQQELYANQIWGPSYNLTTNPAAPSNNGEGADVFSFDLSMSDQKGTNGISEAILGELNGGDHDLSGQPLVSSLEFSVSAITADNTNNLSKWARSKGYNGNDSSALFEKEQSIWVRHDDQDTAIDNFVKDVKVEINGYDGNIGTAISRQFAVKLVQGADGARP